MSGLIRVYRGLWVFMGGLKGLMGAYRGSGVSVLSFLGLYFFVWGVWGGVEGFMFLLGFLFFPTLGVGC